MQDRALQESLGIFSKTCRTPLCLWGSSMGPWHAECWPGPRCPLTAWCWQTLSGVHRDSLHWLSPMKVGYPDSISQDVVLGTRATRGFVSAKGSHEGNQKLSQPLRDEEMWVTEHGCRCFSRVHMGAASNCTSVCSHLHAVVASVSCCLPHLVLALSWPTRIWNRAWGRFWEMQF